MGKYATVAALAAGGAVTVCGAVGTAAIGGSALRDCGCGTAVVAATAAFPDVGAGGAFGTSGLMLARFMRDGATGVGAGAGVGAGVGAGAGGAGGAGAGALIRDPGLAAAAGGAAIADGARAAIGLLTGDPCGDASNDMEYSASSLSSPYSAWKGVGKREESIRPRIQFPVICGLAAVGLAGADEAGARTGAGAAFDGAAALGAAAPLGTEVLAGAESLRAAGLLAAPFGGALVAGAPNSCRDIEG
eukprot:scaffold272162_cov26-Tisochrysis_lutea.AAC.3